MMPSPDGGHSFQRGTLQYRGKDNQWHTAAPGSLVGTKYGTAVEMKNSKTDIVAHRWRLHNWRTGDNQRVDGIDLVISTCIEIQKNC